MITLPRFLAVALSTLAVISMPGTVGAQSPAVFPVPGEHPAGRISLMGAIKSGYLNANFLGTDLLALGNFAIGGYAGFSGELILLDGILYKIPVDGHAQVAKPTDAITYSEYTTFAPTIRFSIADVSERELFAEIARRLANSNLVYSVRIDGSFHHIRYRTVEEQPVPYPSLICAKNIDHVFEVDNTTGTVAGFLNPSFVKGGIEYPGPHVHFIDTNRSKGGHVYDFQVARAEVSIAIHHRYILDLPTLADFAAVNVDNPTKCPEQK